jgi:uncharacterized protein (TIGR00304 family)
VKEALTITVDAGTLHGLGLALVFIGVIIIVVATLLLIFSNTRKGGKVKGGGAIIIGPVPIIFGTDKESLKTILLLSITLTTILVIAFIILYFMSK